MPVIPATQLAYLRDQRPQTARVQWYLAVAPFGDACFTARVNDAAIDRGARSIVYDNDVGEDNVSAGMTLWVGSAAGLYDVGRVRVRSIDTATNTLTVAENSEIEWADDLYLMCPGAYGFRELWGVYPRLTETAGVVNFLMDYDEDFTSPQDTVLPPKANAGPPAVAWIDSVTGLATLHFTGDRSYSTEVGASIDSYGWRFPGAFPGDLPVVAPYAWWSADDITGLADGDPIALWNDSSGNGYNATQGIAARRPTYLTNQVNGHPCARFDDDYMDVPAGFNNFTGGLTIFIVTRSHTKVGAEGWFDVGNGGANNDIVLLRSNTEDLRYRVYDAGVQTELEGTDVIEEDVWELYEIVQAGGVGGAPSNADMYKDGLFVTNGAVDVPNNVARNNNYLGRQQGGPKNLRGDIAELIIYDYDLTDAQRLDVEQYLSTKYDLPLSKEGTCADPVTVQWDTPGFYYASLTVIDDTAQAREATVYVPVWIFDESSDNAYEKPFKLHQVTSQDGDEDNGWRLAVKAFQTNSADEDHIYGWPDGALIVLFTRTWFGGIETGVGGWCMASDKHYRDNIRFVGWLLGETLQHDYASGIVEFEAVAHDGIMDLIPGWPFTIEDIDGVPTDWYQLSDLNVDRALHYLLEYYSTVNQVCHVERVGEGDARTVKIQSYSGESLASQARDDLLGDACCRLLSDRQGILWATRDPQFMDAADRAGVDVACHLLQADWMNDLSEEKPHRPETGMVRIGGFAYDVPLLSRAPGAAPVQSAGDERPDGFILQNQDEANLWSGLMLTRANNDYPQLPLELSGYWPVFDPAYQEYIQLTTTDPLGRCDWADQKFIVREVSFRDDASNSTCITSLVLEKASDILIGETVEVPETPDPPNPPRPSPPIPPPPWGGDLRHMILVTTQGIFITESFDEDEPVWYAANGGLSTNQRTNIRDAAFDFAHGSRMFMVSDHATDGGAFRISDLWSRTGWTQQFTPADATNAINADGGQCTPHVWTASQWSCICCDPIDGTVECIAGGSMAGPYNCDQHKRAFYSNDALDTVTVGDMLTHDPFVGCAADHCSTPWAGCVTTAGGISTYTYVCGWAAGSDQHVGISYDHGNYVDTTPGQIGAWAARPVYHARAGATVYFFVENGNNLYYSTDNGATWVNVGGGGALPHGVPITAYNDKQVLTVHNLELSNLLYCGGANLQLSTDGGATWAATTTNVASSCSAAPAMVAGYPEGEAFIVATGAAPWVCLTVDLGISWEDKTGNLGTWLGAGDAVYGIFPVQEGLVV